MVHSHLVKQHWINRAKEVELLHQSKLREDINWRVEDTAKLLHRSLGSISEDMLIASWLRTHQKQLEKFRTVYEALAFIRLKKKEIRLGL